MKAIMEHTEARKWTEIPANMVWWYLSNGISVRIIDDPYDEYDSPRILDPMGMTLETLISYVNRATEKTRVGDYYAVFFASVADSPDPELDNIESNKRVEEQYYDGMTAIRDYVDDLKARRSYRESE